MMDAREAIINAMYGRIALTMSPQEALDAYAHELAEKIRNHDWDEGCMGVGCCADTPLDAADLIDPEVS